MMEDEQALAKLSELKARREHTIREFEKLTAQVNQLAVAIHQLDGGIAVLEEVTKPTSPS
jgi:predicted nuclease with TOPRIM domain